MQIRNRNLSNTFRVQISREKLPIKMKHNCTENLSFADACCLNATVIGYALEESSDM